MDKIKGILNLKNINLENILCLFIILCPILDIVSFEYRNIFNKSLSPSTVIRPLIPVIVMIYLFFKKDKKFKIYSFIGGLIYFVYAVLHLLVFKTAVTGSSYSTIIHEAQYLINYSFMILNLFIYLYVFARNSKGEKLAKSVLIANVIYVLSIYIAIFTKTSSSTYIEGMGHKGWFESGNSIGSILILSLFINMRYIKDKKMRKIVIPMIALEAIFLTTLLGTRVGLLGFIIVVLTYAFAEVVSSLIRKNRINKKTILGSIATIATILLVVIAVGSTTIQRRIHLQEIEKNIVDNSKKQEAHITGSLLDIKEKIENNTLEDGYMNDAQKQSIMDLYHIANKMKIKNNDQRMQQLIYNMSLIKNQKNTIYILLGNGYMANYRELVLEMEIPAFLFNFGIVRFNIILYAIFMHLDLWSI